LILVRRAGSIRRRETLAPWLHGVARRVAVRARQVARARRRHEIERGAEMKVNSKPDPTRQEELEALHDEEVENTSLRICPAPTGSRWSTIETEKTSGCHSWSTRSPKNGHQRARSQHRR
jgi:hypothetical protein